MFCVYKTKSRKIKQELSHVVKHFREDILLQEGIVDLCVVYYFMPPNYYILAGDYTADRTADSKQLAKLLSPDLIIASNELRILNKCLGQGAYVDEYCMW